MCTKKECKQIAKLSENMPLREILRQLELCEKCCFKKEVVRYKNDTYKKIRLKSNKYYWIDTTKYCESQRYLGGLHV